MALKSNYKKIIKYAQFLGFNFIRSNGSHCVYSNGCKKVCIVKRKNNYTVPNGMLKSILKDLESDVKSFSMYLKKV